MPAALPVVYSRIQDLTDAPTLGAGQNGQTMVWNNATSSFDAQALFTQTAADALYYPLASGNSLSSSLTTHTSDATLHRTIDDSGSATTDLWSASKIASELSSKGVGDFLADGSVAMTGNLDLGGSTIESNDANTAHLLGRASVGHVGFSDHAGFAHRDNATATNYAFMQGSSTGNTFVNARSGAGIYLRNGNVTRAIISTTFDLTSTELDSDDADSAHLLGRASIGYDGTNSDFAAFSHRDSTSGTEYAICQSSAGATFLNCASTAYVSMRVANVEKARLASNGYLGINTTGPDRHLHVVGNAVASALYGGDIQGVFENNGNSGIQIVSSTTGTGSVMFGDTGGGEVGKIFYDHANDRFGFKVGNANMLFMDQYYFEPATDNQVGLGRSGVRFTDVWSVDGTINTSDARDKQDVEPTALGLDFINDLRPVSYRWKEGVGTHRTRHGFIAQEIKEQLDEMGLGEDDFAGYVDGGVRLGLQYSEFIAPMVKAIQQLTARIEALEVS